MSSFLENEAEESDNDYDSDEVARHPRKKRAKPTEDSEEEEDEDDEEAIKNEMKDLINDEEEEEEEESDAEEGGQKRNRDDEESEEDLDEDDLDLLEENLGVKLSRKKKFKRVRRLIDEESEDEGEKDERAAIANELFDDEEGEQRPKNDRRRRADDDDDRYQGISGSEESDDEGNFIVDDNDEPINRPRKKKGYRYNDEAMQQAQDVFGVEFDFDDFQNYGVDDEYEDEQDDEYEEEEEDDGEGGSRIRKKTKAKKKSSRKSIFEVYEPAELEKSFLREQDKKITNADLPERFQLRSTPVTPADDAEIEEEADWIYLNAFSQPSITDQIADASQAVGRTDKQPIGGKKNPSAVPKIRETLKFIRNQSREVPFIQFYRKEYVQPELTNEDLWTIYKWDEKWCQLQQRKTNMKKLLHDMQKYQGDLIMSDPDAPLPEGARIIGETDVERIDKVNSFDELRDCWVQFQLYYGSLFPAMKQAKAEAEKKKRLEQRHEAGEEGDQTYDEEDLMKDKMSSLKLIQRKDFYTVCQEAGILGVATRFGLTPEQFGENLRDSYQKYEVEQIPIEPEEFANDYICTRFPDTDSVTKASKYMVARQLACDPIVRKVIRQIYFERAVVHVRPTKKGMKEIDESHPCFTFKYLRNKPIGEFSNEKFLHLMIAKKEGNVTIRITMDKENPKNKGAVIQTYLDEIKALYQRDEFSSNVQKWNKLRLEALEIALNKFLYPAFEVELTAKVTKEAQEGVIKKSCRKLFDWLKVGPYTPSHEVTDDEDFDIREGLRVLGIAYAAYEDGPSFGALVDGDGEVVEHIRLPNFMLKRFGYATEKEKELREKDRERLKNFILDRKPHVICIGAKDLVCKTIIEDLNAMVSELSDEENIPKIPVEPIDDELAITYMNTKRAIAEFHEFPPILRQAVSLARRLQDPLIEFSQLCTGEDEILCMRYHTLQEHVPKDELLFNLQLEFIYRVNEVGVDINRTLVHNYTSQLLQFVCGLGPRKAAALLRNLKKSPTPLLETRTQLISNCGIGEIVFQNCAGFIKLDTAQLSDTGTETYIEVLDSTRIHPEAYDLARKMAIDALEYDESNDLPSAGALEEIMENPENLKDLDLDAFAEQLAKEGCGNKKTTLYDIREELNHPYRDMREIYRSPTNEEMFHLFTKESYETFYVGKLIMGTVIQVARRKPLSGQTDENNPVRDDETGRWICPVCKKSDFDELNEVWHHYDAELCPGQAIGIRVKLSNGLIGLVPIEKISDTEVINPDERVKPGMVIHCRIIKINVEDRYNVDLTSRTSDLNDKSYHWRHPKDLYYDFDAEDEDYKEEEEKKKKKAGKQNIFKRIIVHENFHNIDFKQSEQLLDRMEQGDVIFRPSSKGPDYLTLTWKVADGIYQHVPILEKNKDNLFSLGRQLYIEGEDVFEDLDEIQANFINPMAILAREITSYKHFKPEVMGNKREAEKVLLEEKKKRNTIVYIVSASKELPGKFLLSYPSKDGKVIHEWISIKPGRIKFRERFFSRFRDVIKTFQENYFRGGSTPLLSAPSQMSHPQMTSPALGLRYQTPQRTPVMASPYHHVPGVPSSAAAAAAAWNRASSSMPPPRTTPQQRTPTTLPPPPEPWNRIVQPGTPSHATPGASSQMSISPSYSPANKGDSTPLLDEWA